MPNRTVREIVAKQKVLTASAKTTVEQAARLMERSQVGTVLVVEKERMVGIFTERDALFRVLAAGREPRTTALSEVMTPHPPSIYPDKGFGHATSIICDGGFGPVP